MEAESRTERTLFESTELGDGDGDSLELRRGETIARYLLLERVGAGGMGVVWAAYDPELDRRVAIKLLRPRRSSGEVSPEARARLVREAQAMARLNHPNVIAVHDVGEHGGRVFVAMEFIESGTLSRWLSARRRSWQEIVGVFAQAGRGLSAAHAAGLVHRDFKPDNVLIGHDGRARVTDFGLARSLELDESVDERSRDPRPASASGAERTARESSTDSGSTPALHTPLTRTGMLLGTPAYMAPEQFANGSFDARSDQFALSVALWEALYGQRPFHGRTVPELAESVGAGKIDPPPTDARVPGFVERALRRGLAVDPAMRWPDVDALLRELERDPALGRRRWMVGGTLVACVVAALASGPLFDEHHRREPEVCPAAHDRIDAVWGHERHRELLTKLSEGERWIVPAVDRYARDWVAMQQDACADTHVRHEQSEDLLDRRMQCLDDRLMQLDATVELLITGDRTVTSQAMTLLGNLPSVARCADREYLEAQIPIPDDVALAEQVAAVRAKIADARALVDAGYPSKAVPTLEQALREAELLGYPPLHAQVQTELGFAVAGFAEPDEVRAQLEEAMAESIVTGQDELAARAGTELVYVLGRRLNRTEEALRLAKLVRAWNERLDAPPVARAQALLSEGAVLAAAGESEAARATLFEALALFGVDEQLGGLDRLDASAAPTATFALNILAVDAHYHGDYRSAEAILAATLAMRGRFTAADDPQMILLRNNIAADQTALGEWAVARKSLSELLELLPSGDDPKSFYSTLVRVTLMEGKLGEAELLGAGDLDRLTPEIEALRRDVAVFEHQNLGLLVEAEALIARYQRLRGDLSAAEATLAALDADVEHNRMTPQAVQIALERGALRLAQAKLSDALTEFERSERLALELGTHEQPQVAVALLGQAQALHAFGRDAEARAKAREALGVWTAIQPKGHPGAALVLDTLAELEPDAAEQHRRDAEAIRERVRDELAGLDRGE